MCSNKQICTAVLIVVGVVRAATNAEAQPIGVTSWTLEARIADADGVVRGTIARLSRKLIVPPGGKAQDGTIWPGGKVDYTVTISVDEVLKGTFKDTVDDLAPYQTFHSVSEFDKHLAECLKAKTPFLWFLGPPEKLDKDAIPKRRWDTLPLEPPADPHAVRVGFTKRGPPLFSMDFSVLKNSAEILTAARAFVKNASGSSKTLGMQIPRVVAQRSGYSGDWNTLILPVAPPLEATAKRLIASPGDFMPKETKLDALSRYQLRFAGVSALRYFKSAENNALLQSLLDDPTEVLQSEQITHYPVRTRACEILLDWGVEFPMPKSAPEMLALDLHESRVTDAGLAQLASFKNLASLNLTATKITNAGMKQLTGLKQLATLDLTDTAVTESGLKELAGLKNLTTLTLSNKQITDAILRELHDAGLLHSLSLARGKDQARPKSAAEVIWLDLSDSQATDTGLKHLAGFKNLESLFLSRTLLTSAGLKELAGFKNLATLYLFDTQVTAAGLKELASLKNLSELALGGPLITDTGLKELAALKNLRLLKLHATKATAAAIAELRRALPRCKINP